MMPPAYNIWNILFFIFLGYFILLLFYYAFLLTAGFSEERRRWWQNITEDYPLLYFSSFTLPVSIIIPARNEEEWIRDTVLSILNLNYPKFELIIVDDGSTDKTLEILRETLDLHAVDTHYIRHFKNGKVQDILKSVKYPNVTVISKSEGLKKAGAVNAGLNIAKYEYVCTMDADTLLEQNALLKIMAQVERDPEKIIGIGSSFGILNGFKIQDGRIAEYSFSYNPILAYQNLEYIRSFFGNRIAWSRFNAMPNIAGGFGIWRRDVLYKLGGYSAEYTCEDIEITFRAHDYIVKNRDKGYRILMMPYYVGWTEGPSNVISLISQRDRWQRVVNETIWNYRHMIFNPQYKFMGILTLPYFVFYEVLGVFVEILSVMLLAVGWTGGLLNFRLFLAIFGFMLLSQSLISITSLFTFVRDQKIFRLRYVLYLIFLSLIELFWYRWIIAFARLSGTLRSLFRYRKYDQYVREKRVKAS